MEVESVTQEEASPVPNLASLSQQPYVSELLSFTLDRLHKEPELLRVDADRIRRQMQEVAVGNYHAFISAADALQAIRREMIGADKHLEFLISEIPKLASGCATFKERGEQILEEWRLNQTLLVHHSTLLDLLEIPQLMDTCMRNGNYDEALDLETYVCKLVTMHPELPVIKSVGEEVRKMTRSLLSQLLHKLRSNIQLPECLRIIGYLHRIGAFSEYEMRLQFLRCREAWLSGVLNELNQSDAYEYLKGMINCHRTQLFDVITQYRAIFADDEKSILYGDDAAAAGLLFSWAMHQITSHLEILKITLLRITDGVSLSNILEQCMYCATGLGGVGLDFRGLLPPLFEGAILSLFSRNMHAAVDNFEAGLTVHKWVPLPAIGGFTSNTGGLDDGDVAPPPYLMEHPPLAVFVNGVAAAMNELRSCCPVTLKQAVEHRLMESLQAVSQCLLTYSTARILRDGDTPLFLALCRAFVDVAYPYCITCFGRCYPQAEVDTSVPLVPGTSFHALAAYLLLSSSATAPADNGHITSPFVHSTHR